MKAARLFTLMLAVPLPVQQGASGQVCPPPEPMGTAFTYQGFLTCTNTTGNTVIVNGVTELRFELLDCDVSGVPQGTTLLFTGSIAIQRDAGSFTMALDSGNVYTGDKRGAVKLRNRLILAIGSAAFGGNKTLHAHSDPNTELTVNESPNVTRTLQAETRPVGSDSPRRFFFLRRRSENGNPSKFSA